MPHPNKNLFILLVLTVFICFCSLPQNKAKESSSPPYFSSLSAIILEEQRAEIFQYWEFSDEDFWWASNNGNPPSIQQYQDSLKSLLDTKYHTVVSREKNQSSQQEDFERTEDRDKINLNLVQRGLLGTIRKMNFMEAQLLEYQISKYPLLSHPTEFHAFIAIHEVEEKVRIYFAASDQGFPPQPRIIISELEKEAKNGWKLFYHLHNHYGNVETDYLGKMAPSLADAQYFMMLKERFGIKKALITNGFTTVEIPSTNFELFESY